MKSDSALPRILVTGGAGYIGSNLSSRLFSRGYFVRIFDNLNSGTAERVDGICNDFVQADIRNTTLLHRSLADIDIVFHLAAYKSVEASTKSPLDFYANNVSGTISLLEALAKTKICSIIFASSSAIYGEYKNKPFTEEDSKLPVSPYGNSKLISEQVIHQFCVNSNISSCSLRYFNVVGSINKKLSDNSNFNLFPNIVRSIENNEAIKISGEEFDTTDGTCIRDYIHVEDVIDANLKILQFMTTNQLNEEFNIGRGIGVTVKQVIDEFSLESGLSIRTENHGRRKGDPGIVIADISKANILLGWKPKKSLRDMVKSALDNRK